MIDQGFLPFPLAVRVEHYPAVSTNSPATSLTADDLQAAADAAYLRGDLERGDELAGQAQRLRDDERWRWELECARRWVPAEPDPELRLQLQQRADRERLHRQRELDRERLRERMSSDLYINDALKRSEDIDGSGHAGDPRDERSEQQRIGRCGRYRWGRLHGRRILLHVPCQTKTCPVCGPRLVELKMEAIPADVELHALEVDEQTWQRSLRRRLARHVDAGQTDGWVKIPRPDGTVLVITDEPIGPVIDREQVAQQLRDRPDGSRVRTSASWRSERRHLDGWEDEGRPTSSPAFVIRHARRLGVPVTVNDHGMIEFGTMTEDQDRSLFVAAQVVTDAEFYEYLHQRQELAEVRRKARQLSDQLRAA